MSRSNPRLVRVLELVIAARATARRRRLPARMARALRTAADRDFAALSPPAIDRRTADRLHRAGLMRVEWCAVLTIDGARAAQTLAAQGTSRPTGPRALLPRTVARRSDG